MKFDRALVPGILLGIVVGLVFSAQIAPYKEMLTFGVVGALVLKHLRLI